MELPKPPDDMDLKNIIDKLANFVARNGPEFEQMTKMKQKDNAKFSFLFRGEFFNYYQYRVTTEQAIINQQKQKMAQQQQAIVQQAIQTAPWQAPQASATPPPNTTLQIAQLDQQLAQHQQQVELQVKQSEQNLAAQYQSLIQQQQVEIDEGIVKEEEDLLNTLSTKCELPLSELDAITQPIIDSCTKDAISHGKNWIFLHNLTPDHGKLMAFYLKKRITDKSAQFELRLHLIYLVNDILHHCLRKNASDLKDAIELTVVPIFAGTHILADGDRQQKLSKLLTLWENNKYFSPTIIEQLQDPANALATYQANLITSNAALVTQITSSINERYTSLQKQHQEFVSHVKNQLQQHQQNIQQQKQQLLAPPPVVTVLPPVVAPTVPPSSQPPPLMGFDPSKPPPNFSQAAKPPPPNFNQPPPFGSQPAGPPPFDYSRPPPLGDFGPSQPPHLPDFSRPPPGFPPVMNDADLMPSVPYFDLPAGLLAPLVKLEDCEYRPLDPKDIRLPPPCPPSERLLAAVEAFYSPPSHEGPRDAEGWEKLGLFEFFKAKLKAKKMKELEGPTDRGRSRSRSRSSSRGRSYSRSRSRSQSPPLYQRRSISRSPPPRRRRSESPPPYQRSSRSRSRSPPPRRRSRSRSATPPNVIGFQPTVSLETRLGGDNRGHMLLKKMGWGGAGLGASEQGIVEPITGGDVREKMDMYKGVGMNMQDPFEQFRKSRSQTFIQRMKTRDENLKESKKAAAAKKDS